MLQLIQNSTFRRGILAKKTGDGPLKNFYQAPQPRRSLDFRDVEFVALDLETTGLSARSNEIVSIGWVLVRAGAVEYGNSGHVLVKPAGGLDSESSVIHKIMDDHLEDARSLADGLAEVLPVLAGRVLIAHHCPIEWSFLSAACERCYGAPFVMPTVDTMGLEQRTAKRRNINVARGGFRLDAVRQKYNLPRYRAHNALIDAIATAELFLAQAAYRGGKGRLTLGELLV